MKSRFGSLLVVILSFVSSIAWSDEPEFVDEGLVRSDAPSVLNWETSYKVGVLQTLDGPSGYAALCERSLPYQLCLSATAFGAKLDSTIEVSYVLALLEGMDLSFGTGISTLPVLAIFGDLFLLMADEEPIFPVPATQIFLRSELTVRVPLSSKLGFSVGTGIAYHAASNDERRFPRGMVATITAGFTRRH